MQVGIDALSFYTPRYYLDLSDFAKARGEDVAKFYDDLGQNKMSIVPPSEDVVTLAANAAYGLLDKNDVADIAMVLFATESSQELSKSAATYVHRLFNLPRHCRVIELKQACYSATFGLQMGLAWLRQNPDKKVLLLASDIARYEFDSKAGSSQGAGAVAMLLTANPRLLAIESAAGFCTKEAMDFWHPDYLDYALVDGRLSCEIYMRLAEEAWREYAKLTGRKFTDFDRFCYHVPLAKLVEKTHVRLAKINGILHLTQDDLNYKIGQSLIYNREVGNCYTASLYLSIISLLENVTDDLGGKLVGLYSYGSGSIGEFFAARVVPGYRQLLTGAHHKNILAARQRLSFAEYKEIWHFKLPTDGSVFKLPVWQTGKFYLQELNHHRRIYAQKE